MIADGINLEIIIPSEGTLTFVKGIMSNTTLEIPDNRVELTATGFRTTDNITTHHSGIYQLTAEIREQSHIADTNNADNTRIVYVQREVDAAQRH